jgi:hypothetical protein
MIKAETALGSAPGVLAVKVEYPSGMATIGTQAGAPVAREEILAALEAIGYRGEFTSRAESEPE